jgi:murein DD-endopeptidase MepM/ murein hydrolase activator NlpD
MKRNWQIIGAWLVRVFFTLPKWWNHDYQGYRIIVEHEDGRLRYFCLPACLQRTVARIAIVAFSFSFVSIVALGSASYCLNAEKTRLESSKLAIFETLLGDTKLDVPAFSEAQLLCLVQEVKDRQNAIQQYFGFSAIAFQEENQNLLERLRETGLTEKAIRAIEQASVGGGLLADEESQQSVQNLLPPSLVQDILKNRELYDVLRALPDQMPLKQFEVSSDFGIRKHPITGAVHFHTGVDLVVYGSKDLVFPAKAGKVITAAMHPQLGNTVVVQHNNGIQTLYAHLQTIDAKLGDAVHLDTVLGTVGNTGAYSTGPHLHFEVLVGGFTTNPIKVIRAARNVQQIQ